MEIIKIIWKFGSKPKCKNLDIVMLVQYGEVEIAKYITPAPKGTPADGGDFIFEVCDNEDDLEEKAFIVIQHQYPEVTKESDIPFLFLCPVEISKNIVWE